MEADDVAGRRRVLAMFVAPAVLAGCMPPERFDRIGDAPLTLPRGEGLAVFGVRRLGAENCRDMFFPDLLIESPNVAQPARSLTVPAGVEPDRRHPFALRNLAIVRLPAGTNAIVAFGGFNSDSRVSLPRWAFSVAEGAATYVGGIGIATRFRQNTLWESWARDCVGLSGEFFHFTDYATDSALWRERFPALAAGGLRNGSGERPARWARGPLGYD